MSLLPTTVERASGWVYIYIHNVIALHWQARPHHLSICCSGGGSWSFLILLVGVLGTRELIGSWSLLSPVPNKIPSVSFVWSRSLLASGLVLMPLVNDLLTSVYNKSMWKQNSPVSNRICLQAAANWNMSLDICQVQKCKAASFDSNMYNLQRARGWLLVGVTELKWARTMYPPV